MIINFQTTPIVANTEKSKLLLTRISQDVCGSFLKSSVKFICKIASISTHNELLLQIGKLVLLLAKRLIELVTQFDDWSLLQCQKGQLTILRQVFAVWHYVSRLGKMPPMNVNM